jgi:hypothetical protein
MSTSRTPTREPEKGANLVDDDGLARLERLLEHGAAGLSGPRAAHEFFLGGGFGFRLFFFLFVGWLAWRPEAQGVQARQIVRTTLAQPSPAGRRCRRP